MINVDAKLASKVFVGKIKKILPNIIKHNQTAYVTGKYIEHTICLIHEILEYVEETNMDGILFSADFEKAFLPYSIQAFLPFKGPGGGL